MAGGWRGHLQLHYTLRSEPGGDGPRTVAHDRHEGPLRVLRALYPEGPGICHHVLVHPPGGMVAGDELRIDASLAAGTHALVTTPGANRFYRSDGPLALQHSHLQLGPGARLEWLPMETIAYPGCRARNVLRAELAPGAEMMGWEVLALGLPAAGRLFAQPAANATAGGSAEGGWFEQHLELPGVWLDRGRVAAADGLLLDSALGWAGRNVLATLWFASGSALARPRRDALLEAARSATLAHPLAASAGTTAPQSSVVVLRALAAQVEPALQLMAQVRAAWRRTAWDLAAPPPRIWKT